MPITFHDTRTDQRLDVRPPTGPETARTVLSAATEATEVLSRTSDDSTPLCGCNGW